MKEMENGVKSNKVATTQEKRKPSASYTVKQMGENIRKLKELEMINEAEVEQLQKLHKKIVEKFIGIYMQM